MSKTTITHITAREILDSRGNPTLEAEVRTENGMHARAAVPSGASTGEHEAREKRDGDKARYLGKGVQQAVEMVKRELGPALLGMDAREQCAIDARLCEIDGSEGKERCGANAVLAVSLAVARVAARSVRLPLYRYLGGVGAHLIPVPLINVVNAGSHSDAPIDIQEFMLVPSGLPSFREALRCGSEIFHVLGQRLRERGFSAAVGDEGGYAPPFRSVQEVLDSLMLAIEHTGYKPGEQVQLALDVAASEFYHAETGLYVLDKSSGAELTAAELIEEYKELCRHYPIVSIEDGCAENDWLGWERLTAEMGDVCQLVGDDLFVTNTAYIKQGIERGAANALLVKPNQIGTLTETLEAVRNAQTHGYRTIISHRSGDTEDSFIADLAVAVNAGQIKTGSLSRSERLAKYNRLLRIEEQLGPAATFSGRDW